MQGLEKIIELLKTGGWQAFFVSLSLMGFLVLESYGVFDVSAIPLIIPVVWLMVAVLFGISAAAFGDFVKSLLKTHYIKKSRIQAEQALRKKFVDDIPYLSQREKQIFGYMIEKSVKRFNADSTGDYASGLIAKGYIKNIARPGAHYQMSRFPFEVPEYVWEEVIFHKDQFPYVPRKSGRDEIAPWIEVW